RVHLHEGRAGRADGEVGLPAEALNARTHAHPSWARIFRASRSQAHGAALDGPADASRSRSGASVSNVRIAARSDQGLRQLTSAFSPCRAKSLVPLFVHTSAQPLASASSAVLHQPAFRSAATNT